jgi:hypothetical protein
MISGHDLFDYAAEKRGGAGRAPLAARMRPRAIDEILGQDHILGPGKLLRRAIEADTLGSIILYGPPGQNVKDVVRVGQHVGIERPHIYWCPGSVSQRPVSSYVVRMAVSINYCPAFEAVLIKNIPNAR